MAETSQATAKQLALRAVEGRRPLRPRLSVAAVARARIRRSAEAVGDLAGIHDHIARASPGYASATAGRLVAAVDRLGEFPQSGRVVPELGDPLVREVIHGAYRHGAYRIVYAVRVDASVEVLTVFHGARRFPELAP